MFKNYFFLVFFGVIFLFFLTSDYVARFVYGRLENPRVALVLVRADEKLARDIGDYYFGGGAYDLSLAEHAYKKALLVDQGILWGHYQLARIYFVKGDFPKALEEINLELKYNPANLRALYVRGLIYAYRGNRGDLEYSENDFYRFIEWAPTEWAGYNDLAWVLLLEKKFSEAVSVLEKAFKNAPEGDANPWLLNNMGLAYKGLKNFTKASVAFKRAVEFGEDMPFDEWGKAYPGNSLKDREKGFLEFKKSIQKNLKSVE